MSLHTLRDLLIEQLNELEAAENHRLKVLPRLENAANSPELATLLRKECDQSQHRLVRLDSAFSDLGIRPRRVETQGMKGLLADCLRLAQDKSAEPHVRDAAVIAAAQHVSHDQIAGYGCARTWSNLLGCTQSANLLQKSLDEEKDADASLSRLAGKINQAALEPAAA
jgi:ferritin-like metal-binding protein YciE